jgi:hypothetical protein
MKTLYDILNAHPDDDAERLKVAFRKAAMACHPDLNLHDPEAPVRFIQIVRAKAYPLHAPVPFTAEDGARPHLGDTLNQVRSFLSCLLRRFRTIEQMLGLAIQVPEPIGL